MMICKQCNGSKVMRGQEGNKDISGNTQSFQAPTESPDGVACSQCNGTGIQTSFGV